MAPPPTPSSPPSASRRGPRRHPARRRNAAHGRHHLPQETDGPAPAAGGDVLVAGRRRPSLMDALDAGAVDVILKPRIGTRDSCWNPRCGSATRSRAPPPPHRPPPPPRRGTPAKLTADAMLPPQPNGIGQDHRQVVCIGASTGGTESLRVVIQMLPADCPGIAIVSTCRKDSPPPSPRLDSLCGVGQGSPGRRPHRPRPGGDRPGNSTCCCGVAATAMSPRSRTGAGVASSAVGGRAVRSPPVPPPATRWHPDDRHGDDGAKLLEMRQAGAFTIAEDESTCVCRHPKEAIAAAPPAKPCRWATSPPASWPMPMSEAAARPRPRSSVKSGRTTRPA